MAPSTKIHVRQGVPPLDTAGHYELSLSILPIILSQLFLKQLYLKDSTSSAKNRGNGEQYEKGCRPCYDSLVTAELADMARKKLRRVNSFCSDSESIGLLPMCLDCFNTIHRK